MQFRIPQFLDIEDQVFGPFTFKQFGYMLGAIAFAYIFWKLIPYKILSLPLILLFSGTFMALAFVKINNRPFAYVLESGYKFLIGNKTYVWQKERIEEQMKEEMRLKENILKKEKIEHEEEKKVTLNKLKELSSKLDILDEERKNNLSLREEIMKRRGMKQI